MHRRELLKGVTTAALGMFLKPSFQEAWLKNRTNRSKRFM